MRIRKSTKALLEELRAVTTTLGDRQSLLERERTYKDQVGSYMSRQIGLTERISELESDVEVLLAKRTQIEQEIMTRTGEK